jgi:hypothetical protein
MFFCFIYITRFFFAEEVSVARVVVCVYNSAHKVDATTFKIVPIDEAHCVRRPAIYADLDDSADSADSANGDEAESDGDDAAESPSAWSSKFDELVAYHAANGKLPPKSAPGGVGYWINKSRRARATMGAARGATVLGVERSTGL